MLFRLLTLLIAGWATTAVASTVQSGSIVNQTVVNSNSETILNLTTADFVLSASLRSLPQASLCADLIPAAGCLSNFTSTGITPAILAGASVTIGGVTYTHNAGGTMVILLNLVGPTTPYLVNGGTGSAGPVPFTMTGSFSFIGPGLNLSGTLEGSGTATAGFSSNPNTGLIAFSNMQYNFAPVPEPGSWALAALGTASAVLHALRRRYQSTTDPSSSSIRTL